MLLFAFLLLAAPQDSSTQHSNFHSLDPQRTHSPDNILPRFNYFDLELLQSFDDKRNYFISPASIKSTLGMILEGARGKCAEEISRVLRIPLDQSSSSRQKLSSILYDFNSKPGTTLVESANGAFISNVYRVVPEYEHILRNYYKADVRAVDFSNNDYAARLINGWVYNKTRGLITDIITPANFNSDATLVIVNALYFQGKWKSEFEQRSTSIKCFYGRNGCTNTKMMQTVDNFPYKYIASLDAEAISLPYGDGQYSMLVVLPSKQQSVDLLVRDIKFLSVASIVSMLEPTEVFVNLPRFEIEHTADIVSDLQRLGIEEIFGPNANLSGIIQRGQIKINNIVHKAKIEVNERGTTAAGATGVIVIPLMGTSMPRFVADRPFLFFIYHGDSKNILFAGRLNYVKEAYDEIFTKPPNVQPQQTYSNQKQNKQQPAPLSLDNRPVKHNTNPQSHGISSPANSQWRPAVDPPRPQIPSQLPINSQWKPQEQTIRQHGNSQTSETKQPIYFGTDTVRENNAYSSQYYAVQ